MPHDHLAITIDHEQTRMVRDAIAMCVFGEEWENSVWASTWIDPVTSTLMLRPMSEDAAWYTSNAGIYAKPTLASLTQSGAWVEHVVWPSAGAFWKSSVVDEWLMWPSNLGTNRPMYVAFFVYGAGDEYIALECGYNGTVGYLDSVSFRISSGGNVEVWKDGIFQAQYSIGGFQSGQNAQNKPIELLFIPGRRRDIIVVSNQGGGFVHTFDDIEETDTAPVITADAPFWVQNKSGHLDVLFCPVAFPTTGYATSEEIQLMYPPDPGASLQTWSNPDFSAITTARILGDKAYAGATDVSGLTITQLDGATAFLPDGASASCRLRITLSGDGDYSPFIYGAYANFVQTFAVTPDASFDLTSYVTSAKLEVPDDPGGVRFSCDLREPQTLDEGTDAPKLLTISNRPFKTTLGDVQLMDAISEPPHFTDGLVDENRRAKLSLRDMYGQLENYMFRERVPLDGMLLCKPAFNSEMSAVELVLRRALGDDIELDLEDVDYRIDEVPSRKAGEDFNFLISVGDTAARVIERLQSDFAASYVYGFKPLAAGPPKFMFRDPDTLDATPVIELYRTTGDAIAAGATEDTAIAFTFHGFEGHPLEVEANEVRATGWDPRAGRPIQAYKVDTDSADPTIMPALRPDNWIGNPRVMGVLSRKLSSQAACGRCVAFLFPVVTARRKAGQFGANEFLRAEDGTPVWRFDVVRLYDELGGFKDYRIASLSVDFEREYTDEPNVDNMTPERAATYCGIEVGTGAPSGYGGLSLADIRHHAMIRAINKELKWPEWEDLAKYKPGVVLAVS